MPSPQPVTPITAIGQFIVAFSRVEHVLRLFVGYGLELERHGLEVFDAIVRPYDFAMLCTIVDKLATKLPKYIPEKENVAALIKTCRKLNDARVKVAHGTWGHGPGASHLSRSSLKTVTYFADINELCRLEKKSAETYLALIDLLVRVRDNG